MNASATLDQSQGAVSQLEERRPTVGRQAHSSACQRVAGAVALECLLRLGQALRVTCALAVQQPEQHDPECDVGEDRDRERVSR
ncbi:MAG: hypothetical protein ACREV7_04400 [Steroidobacteraceae bacterium]